MDSQPPDRDQTRLNIVLTGFMAVGKTTIGKRVARRLSRPFYDADVEIINRTGMQVTAIFTQCGEPRFRKLESTMCRWLAAREGSVISTGGGMVVNPDNLAALVRTGVVVCLNASPDVLRKRIAANKARPLAQDWERLYEQRKAAYAAVPYQINTDGKSPEYVAMEIVKLWQAYP
jgi:shikimate kinase